MGPPNAVNRMIPSCLKWLYIWTHIVQTVRLLYQKLCHPPSEPRNKPSYFPLYWLFNRDPYNGLSKSPYNWVVLKSPIYIYIHPEQPVCFIAQAFSQPPPNLSEYRLPRLRWHCTLGRRRPNSGPAGTETQMPRDLKMIPWRRWVRPIIWIYPPTQDATHHHQDCLHVLLGNL